MNKRYFCHQCDEEFIRPADDDPLCPRCDSGDVTFEELIEPSLLQRLWNLIKPVVCYFFVPWKQFRGAELPRSGFYFLILLHTGMLVGVSILGWHHVQDFASQQTLLPGSFWILRDISWMVQPFYPGGSPWTIHGLFYVYALILAWECLWFGGLYTGCLIAGAKADSSAVVARAAGYVWIPNLCLGALQILLIRAEQLSLFPVQWMYGPTVGLAFKGVVVWSIVALALSLISLPDLKLINFPVAIVLSGVFQAILGGCFLFALNYLYPLMDLPLRIPADGHWILTVRHLIAWPL